MSVDAEDSRKIRVKTDDCIPLVVKRSRCLPGRHRIHPAVDHARSVELLEGPYRIDRLGAADAVDGRSWHTSRANYVTGGGVLLAPHRVYEKLNEINVVRSVRATTPHRCIDPVEDAYQRRLRSKFDVCHPCLRRNQAANFSLAPGAILTTPGFSLGTSFVLPTDQ